MHDDLVKRLRRDATAFVGFVGEDLRQAADAIEELSKLVDESIPKSDAEIIIEELSKPRWIPVTEQLPETGVDVLVKFPQNMAVASIDIGEWVVNSGDGWCTDIDLAGGEKNPTHWMPLPQPPKEGET